MKYTFGFIGTGNMGGTMARCAVKGVGAGQVVVMNRSPEKARALASDCGCAVCESALEVAQSAKFVVLGVKPNQIAGVIEEILPALSGESVLVSMAAGVRTEVMREKSGGVCGVIRILPNTPCALGKGAVLISASPREEASARELAAALAPAGLVLNIPESQMDAGCSAAGCTPAYGYMFIDALAAGAEKAGLPRDMALKLCAQAVLGAAEMVLQGSEDPQTLCDRVCSPGGSTVEGVKALQNGGFAPLVRDALYASYERNVELGK